MEVARRIGNITGRLAEEEQDAAKAEQVLLDREAAHEGFGATAEQIAKLKASAETRASKDWSA